jgi:hypothetical protein
MDWPGVPRVWDGLLFRRHRLGPADAPEELDGFPLFRLRFAARHHLGHLTTVDGTARVWQPPRNCCE